MSEGKPFINSGQLFDCKNAFHKDKSTDILFIEAFNEALKWHITHCSDYKSFLMENGIADFKEKYNPEVIPPILVDVFKQFKIISVPEKQIKFEIENENRKIILDARSQKRIMKIYENIFASLDLTDFNQKVNYICFTYDSKFSEKPDNNFFYDLLTGLTAHRSVYFAIRFNKITKDFFFDTETTSKKIIDFACHSEPIRIIGNSDYLLQIISWFESNKIQLKLPEKSLILTLNNKLNADIKKKCQEIFDISENNIKNIFILPEQGIPFIDCKCGYYHLPVYADCNILDAESLLALNEGEIGLLSLLTPYITSYPAISLLTTYKTAMTYNCPCGFKGKSFKLI